MGDNLMQLISHLHRDQQNPYQQTAHAELLRLKPGAYLVRYRGCYLDRETLQWGLWGTLIAQDNFVFGSIQEAKEAWAWARLKKND